MSAEVADMGISIGARRKTRLRLPRPPRSLLLSCLTVVLVLVAWVLVRYTFPGRKVIDALVDIPFALPTAVAYWRGWSFTRS